ncbi:SRPBCC family protein [Pedobacter heparinus]|uniref:SRPBCC family protein n=1 Tax=Pedobacter heparinus TaxID=984 RepID=UPI00292D935C|nr:SRPBCC family protein [Pedobacter heparinus]
MEQKNERFDTASRVIKAPAHRIYLAFLDPEAIASWRPPAGMECEVYEFEPSIGGKYKMAFKYTRSEDATAGKTSANADVFNGIFVELIADRKIVELIKFESDDPAFAEEMKMTTRLTPVKDGTEVTFIAENVPSTIKKEDHDEGMRSSLENLAKFMEQ